MYWMQLLHTRSNKILSKAVPANTDWMQITYANKKDKHFPDMKFWFFILHLYTFAALNVHSSLSASKHN